MGKISNNTNKNKGFTLVEVLLLIVVLILVGGLGYLGYKQVNKKSKTSTATTAKTAAVDPYAGWKTGTLKYEKITFKYPADWTLDDYSMPYSPPGSEVNPYSCLKPGEDKILLTSPYGSTVNMGVSKDEGIIECGGGGFAGNFPDSITFAAPESVKFAGSDIFIVYPYDLDVLGVNGTNIQESTRVSSAFLNDVAMPTPDLYHHYIYGVTTKNISKDSEPGTRIKYSYSYYNGNDKSYAAMQADPGLALAKKIFESISY
jgi:hypothetical protein